jgi:ribosomal protein S27AE
MFEEQSDGTFKIARVPETCHECARVIVGEAHLRYGRTLCGKCLAFYSNWPVKPEEAESKK